MLTPADFPVLAASLIKTEASDDTDATITLLITAAEALHAEESRQRLQVKADGYTLIAEHFFSIPANEQILEEAIGYIKVQYDYWFGRANAALLELNPGVARHHGSTWMPVEVLL